MYEKKVVQSILFRVFSPLTEKYMQNDRFPTLCSHRLSVSLQPKKQLLSLSLNISQL